MGVIELRTRFEATKSEHTEFRLNHVGKRISHSYPELELF